MESHMIMQRILDREFYRVEAALDKNFEYLDRMDREREDALARAQVRAHPSSSGGDNSRQKKEKSAGVYITGLSTYTACKQLETICHRLGRVKRIKFYKDERGSLKGDALVVFSTVAMMDAAIAKLHNFELRPGIRITAAAADYSQAKKPAVDGISPDTAAPAPSTQLDLVDAFLQEMQENLHGGLGATADTPAAATAPAFVLSTEAPAVATPVPPPQVMPAENELDEPSRSVVLRGILDEVEDPSHQATSSDEYLDVEEDLRIECSNFGTVVQVTIRRESNDVAVEFDALDSAIACLKAMHGRWFGGQQIRASFDPAKPEANVDDPDLMLQAFLASV